MQLNKQNMSDIFKVGRNSGLHP